MKEKAALNKASNPDRMRKSIRSISAQRAVNELHMMLEVIEKDGSRSKVCLRLRDEKFNLAKATMEKKKK
ncbi:hypothetical protein PVAND_009535 [Polypedilum vanderplanki]|uniref:Uncharacterized protein n=1 Tax=Polypedilum vanderplanki TaxID=319348 RepID=A0A9J6CD80_POLVA|nr:hypothetical protein PVAND_009535 [Polypedilum vanderplanki]